MIFVDPQSFAIGVLTGVVGFGIALGFAAALFAFAGADAIDKRGLSGRHRPEGVGANLLSGPPFVALPAVALQRDSAAPGSFTVAGRVSPARPPRPKRPSRSRPESPRDSLG